jgi:hypothetical protein
MQYDNNKIKRNAFYSTMLDFFKFSIKGLNCKVLIYKKLKTICTVGTASMIILLPFLEYDFTLDSNSTYIETTVKNLICKNKQIKAKDLVESNILTESLNESIWKFNFSNTLIPLEKGFNQYEKEASINLNLTIWPVRFIYLDEEENIVKIWNNVQTGHDVYILKVFDLKDNVELEIIGSVLIQYFEILKNVDIFAQGYIFDTHANGLENNENFSSDINVEYRMNYLEEIYTYL